MTSSLIKTELERLYSNRSPKHLSNDPLSFCHRYDDPADQEIAALIASSFAYGGIKIILRTLESIFSVIGPSPRSYIESFNPQDGLKVFEHFKHRFNDGRDLTALLWGIRTMISQTGSINNYFLQGCKQTSDDITVCLNAFSTAILASDYSPVFGTSAIPSDSYFRFLFPAPSSGSACKRLCMFLRWVVRPDDGIDLGIWHGISPDRLVIPVDTHISRICTYLGFTTRRSADWRMAQEITAALRKLDPTDPVRYDFSLAHLGISEGCSGSDPLTCRLCTIAGICPQSGFPSRKSGTLIN